jgi:nucleoside-diphosphate-sugar epimerase
MRHNIFITGATGFLGKRLLARILNNTDADVFLLARPTVNKKELSSRLKLNASDAESESMLSRHSNRINIVKGDVAVNGLGMQKKLLKYLHKKIDVIYHLAAQRDIKNSRKNIITVNKKGTTQILDFALQCKKSGRLERVNHVSTAYVLGSMGLKDIVFYEKQLELNQAFNNQYEKSKYEAEIVINRYRKAGLPINVFRPSIILESMPITDYKVFSDFFRPFSFFVSGMFKSIPARADARYNFISVDDAAHAIFMISNTEGRNMENYHIVNKRYVSLRRIIAIAGSVFRVRVPFLKPLNCFDFEKLSCVQSAIIKPFVPYMNFRARFNSDNASRILDKKNFRYNYLKDYEIRRVFEYMRDNKLWKRGL